MKKIKIILNILGFGISLLIFLFTLASPFLLVKSCEHEAKIAKEKAGTYTVKYEVIYSDKSRIYIEKTKYGKAKVDVITRSFSNAVIYRLMDEKYNIIYEGGCPVAIINQTRN